MNKTYKVFEPIYNTNKEIHVEFEVIFWFLQATHEFEMLGNNTHMHILSFEATPKYEIDVENPNKHLAYIFNPNMSSCINLISFKCIYLAFLDIFSSLVRFLLSIRLTFFHHNEILL